MPSCHVAAGKRRVCSMKLIRSTDNLHYDPFTPRELCLNSLGVIESSWIDNNKLTANAWLEQSAYLELYFLLY